MQEYLTIDELVEKTTKHNIDLGKGDPYNRLRYYTKMGWIPHMVRKKDDTGSIKGHYPISTLDRLIYIQQLKNNGLSNEEISHKIRTKEKVGEVYGRIFSEQSKGKLVRYGVFIMVFIIFAGELGIINIGKPKDSQIILQASTPIQRDTLQLIDSGTAFIPQDSNQIIVKSGKIQNNSKVYVSFTQTYTPATKFWVAEKLAGEGFRVELDTPVSQDSSFDWWITD
jgi:DNA-binding transcriptional MerR regulator